MGRTAPRNGLPAGQGQARAQLLIENHIIDAAALRRLAPALSHEMLGAEYAPQRADQPAESHLRRAAAAQARGARFVRGASVQQIERIGSGWRIGSSRCEVDAGRIVNAAGPWSREIAALVGVDLPVHSAPLQMIVTEAAPVLVTQLVAHADRHLSLKQAATGG